jgi:capsular polysaccharide biosynthesis protein
MSLARLLVHRLRRAARRSEKLFRTARIYALAGLRELAATRTRLNLPRNQLFPLQASQADGVAVRLVDPEEPFERPPPHQPGEAPGGHPVFRQHRSGFFPATFVAELRGGRVWTYYNSAVLTADGRLVPELSKDMWGDPALHAIFTRMRLPAPRILKGRTLSLITPEAQANYHHWMIDLLPRAGLVQRAGWDLRGFDQVLVKDRGYPFQKETVRTLGLDETKIIHVGEADHFVCESLVAPALRFNNTLVRPADLRFVRSLFLPAPHEIATESPAHPGAPRRRLYLGRRDAAHRRIINEEGLRMLLREYGFEEVSMSGMSVAQQAALLASAEIVAGPNGSALANLVFAPSSCHVIEFFAPGWVVIYDWMICAALGFDHTAIIGRGPRPDPTKPPRGIKDDIELDLAVLEKTLTQLAPRNPAKA